ncbi:MAG: hypothetical protein ACRDRI_08220 [Pseudonocardiaceae bacterium]
MAEPCASRVLDDVAGIDPDDVVPPVDLAGLVGSGRALGIGHQRR